MIDNIVLDNLNLKAFAGAPHCGAPSEVLCSNVEFRKGSSYLIEAGSGRGKSSFCAFLCGLRNDYTGTICLGDRILKGVYFVYVRVMFQYSFVGFFCKVMNLDVGHLCF